VNKSHSIEKSGVFIDDLCKIICEYDLLEKLLFSGSLDEQHGSEEPDDHGCWQEY